MCKFFLSQIYSPNAYRGYARELIKNLEQVRPSSIVDIIHSAEAFEVGAKVGVPTKRNCARCGFISSNEICQACTLLESLNGGLKKKKIEIGFEEEEARVQ